MMTSFKTFLANEDGAVTVDFVVLTAAIVLLGLAVGTTINSGATSLADDIQNDLTTIANTPGAALGGAGGDEVVADGEVAEPQT